MSGLLYIVSAPSGAGKTSLVRALLAADPLVRKSISYTTREQRPGEQDGRDYHFVTVEQFDDMGARGEFLESALVHGNRYGTSERRVAELTQGGCDVVLEIDWQGAAQVRKLKSDAVSIFILPPSLAQLEARLRERAQDEPLVIAKRVAAAPEEIAHFVEFDYVIINEDFNQAARDLASIVRAARLTLRRQLARRPDFFNRLR
jgi:guanylate kinase